MAYPFTLLNERIQYWIGKLGFSKPTEIQGLGIKPILDGENVLLVSPTGSGKTEAAIFPLLSKLLNENSYEGVKLLYVNPLKALTRDLTERINTYALFLGLKVRPLYGDVNKAFKKPVPDIIIITPESLEIVLDWSPKWWPYFKTIKYVVIDEVHELVSSKRGYQLLVLLERLKQLTGHSLQRIGLSATIANAGLVAEVFGGSDGKLKVICSPEERRHEFELKLAIPLTREEVENPFLAGARLVSECIGNAKSLIFVNSRYTSERLMAEIEKAKIPVAVHHGSIGLEEREVAEDAFKEGTLKAVIATKTLELGIDIGDVEQVIQYRSPGQVNALIQRAGRSLHKPGQRSVCKIISTDPEDFLECLALVNLFNKNILEEPFILKNPLDVLAKEILGCALHNYQGRRKFKEKFIPVTLQNAYQVIRNCHLFNTLTLDEFKQVLNNLANSGLLVVEDDVFYPGSRFWSVWRFEKVEEAKWPSLKFNEFFSMIPKRESFSVWAEHGFGKRRKLGELDSSFVFRSLATGMIIRFAGSNWKVSEIDEKGHNVFVVEVKEGGEIPSWRGEGPQRSEKIAKEMLSILCSLTKDPNSIFKLVNDMKIAENVLEYVKGLDRLYLDFLRKGIIVEVLPAMRTWIFITFAGEKVNRTLASAIFEKITESSLLVKYVVSPIGFAFRSEVINPLRALKSIKIEEFRGLVEKHVKESSPFTKLVKDQIKEHFGFPYDEVLVDREAAKQAMEIYYDLNRALSFFRKIKKGYLIEVSKDKPSQLGESVIKYPFERTWLINLRAILKEVLDRCYSGTLDDIFEYTWSNPLEAKRELQKLTREMDLIAFLDLNVRGWSIAKVPLEEEWVTIKVPVATKYFVMKSKNDIKKIRDELLKERFQLAKLLNQEVKVSFIDIKTGIEEPYRLRISKTFDIVLDSLSKIRLKKKYDKIDLKVHIEGTRVTMVHYGVPLDLTKPLIERDIGLSYALIERNIVSGRRQLVFEFP